MNIMRDQIRHVFKNFNMLSIGGVWFSGIEGEGIYKEWWDNGALYVQANIKNGLREGEHKKWFSNGSLWEHCFYKNNALDGIYKRWHEDGSLIAHAIFKKGELVKDYM